MANGLPLIVWVHDAAGEQVMVNDTFCEFFGVSREEMKGGRWQVLMHPEDAEAYTSEFLACVREQRPFRGEARVKRADGQWRRIESWARPRFSESGEFHGMVGTSADITDRKHSQEAREHAEQRYRALFESIEQGFCVFEMIFDAAGRPVDYRFLETNPAFERHTGLVDAVGKTALELVPDLEPEWPEAYGRVAMTGQPEQFVQGSDAMGRWFEVAASRVGRPEERRVALLFTDISERRRTEQALRASEHKFRTLADNISQLVWMADEHGAAFWFNHRWHEYTGATLDEMRGSGWEKVLHPDDVARVSARMQRSWDTGEPWEDTFPLRGSDGQYRWFLSRALPIRDSDGTIVRWFGTSTDVTEQRNAEERLRESDRRKDEYLAMLGHELRNPLAAIRTATELLALTECNDPRVDRAVGVLSRQSEHVARLIDGLLEVSRIARGKIGLRLVTLDLRSICEQVLDDRRELVHARGLALELDVPDEPVWVRADPVRLAQVLDNLVGNALKFTSAPGRIAVVLRAEHDRAVVRVQDTGIGIRPDRLVRIFDPFHQEGQDAARDRGGLGLGLALSKGLVELHGGAIEARSEGLGTGTELDVRLPLAPAPPHPAPHERDDELAARRILLVEDHADAAQMLVELLALQGHQVTIASTGREALDALRRERASIGIVLCDIGLPGMSGYDVARAIRADADLRNVPLVALTGYGQPEDRERTAEAGFDAHLIKPVTVAALTTVIRRLTHEPA